MNFLATITTMAIVTVIICLAQCCALALDSCINLGGRKNAKQKLKPELKRSIEKVNSSYRVNAIYKQKFSINKL